MTRRESFGGLDVSGVDFEEKADKSAVDGKADQGEVDTNTANIGDLQNNKADQSQVDTNTSDIGNLESNKADTSYVDSGLDTKADQTQVDTNSSDIDDLQSRTEGRLQPVTSVNDSDGTTPLDISLTVPDSKAYQSYRLIGYIWGSTYSQGEGGEIDIDYTINGYTTGVYEYTLLSQGTMTWMSDQSSWTDKIWRRYKNPVDFTISADNETVTTSDGNESMFISMGNNSHQGFRGMLNGRMGDNWVDGGHPFSEINSVEVSSTDDLEAKLVLYGIDWKSDL